MSEHDEGHGVVRKYSLQLGEVRRERERVIEIEEEESEIESTRRATHKSLADQFLRSLKPRADKRSTSDLEKRQCKSCTSRRSLIMRRGPAWSGQTFGDCMEIANSLRLPYLTGRKQNTANTDHSCSRAVGRVRQPQGLPGKR